MLPKLTQSLIAQFVDYAGLLLVSPLSCEKITFGLFIQHIPPERQVGSAHC